MAGAMPPCLVTAYGYTLLTGKGAQLVIGGMLMLTVPLRYMLRRRAVVLHNRGLVLGSVGYGAAVGGTVGAGVILLSLLMAAGLAGQAVIATDAVLSIFIGGSRLMVFGVAGAITAQDHRIRASDRRRGVSRRVPGQGLRRAPAAARAHRDPRRGGVVRRRGDGVRRADEISQGHFTTRRHRRQDRVDIAAGAQAEDRAAVVEQVELDIAAAAHELLVALGLGPGLGEIASHQLRIDFAGTRGRRPA